MINLKNIWDSLTSTYCNNERLRNQLWQEINKSYSAKSRHYHNLDHLKYMMMHALENEALIDDTDVLKFSIFYHDIVYDIHKNNNEEKSAEIARFDLKKLGVSEDKIQRCKLHILATKDHDVNSYNDTNLLVDMDLAILGESPEKYQTYVLGIRHEYSFYPDFLYKKGRMKVLKHFLHMERIFKSDFFFEKYEETARQNISSELELLKK